MNIKLYPKKKISNMKIFWYQWVFCIENRLEIWFYNYSASDLNYILKILIQPEN